ncbi:MAG: hypothetical protein P8Z00_01250 [Anaerolineales bacterium]
MTAYQLVNLIKLLNALIEPEADVRKIGLRLPTTSRLPWRGIGASMKRLRPAIRKLRARQ